MLLGCVSGLCSRLRCGRPAPRPAAWARGRHRARDGLVRVLTRRAAARVRRRARARGVGVGRGEPLGRLRVLVACRMEAQRRARERGGGCAGALEAPRVPAEHPSRPEKSLRDLVARTLDQVFTLRDLVARTTGLCAARRNLSARTTRLCAARRNLVARTTRLCAARRNLVARTTGLCAVRRNLVARPRRLCAARRDLATHVFRRLRLVGALGGGQIGRGAGGGGRVVGLWGSPMTLLPARFQPSSSRPCPTRSTALPPFISPQSATAAYQHAPLTSTGCTWEAPASPEPTGQCVENYAPGLVEYAPTAPMRPRNMASGRGLYKHDSQPPPVGDRGDRGASAAAQALELTTASPSCLGDQGRTSLVRARSVRVLGHAWRSMMHNVSRRQGCLVIPGCTARRSGPSRTLPSHETA